MKELEKIMAKILEHEQKIAEYQSEIEKHIKKHDELMEAYQTAIKLRQDAIKDLNSAFYAISVLFNKEVKNGN